MEEMAPRKVILISQVEVGSFRGLRFEAQGSCWCSDPAEKYGRNTPAGPLSLSPRSARRGSVAKASSPEAITLRNRLVQLISRQDAGPNSKAGVSLGMSLR